MRQNIYLGAYGNITHITVASPFTVHNIPNHVRSELLWTEDPTTNDNWLVIPEGMSETFHTPIYVMHRTGFANKVVELVTSAESVDVTGLFLWGLGTPLPAVGALNTLYLNFNTGEESVWDNATMSYIPVDEHASEGVFRVTFGVDILAGTVIDLTDLDPLDVVSGDILPLLAHHHPDMEVVINDISTYNQHTVLSPTTLTVAHDIFIGDILRVTLQR